MNSPKYFPQAFYDHQSVSKINLPLVYDISLIIIMEDNENKEFESDGEEYQLPPVQLPKRAITSVKSIKESLITVPNLFHE